jgi:hypothetical protein
MVDPCPTRSYRCERNTDAQPVGQGHDYSVPARGKNFVATKPKPAEPTVDDLFTDYPPTIIPAPNTALYCLYQGLTKTEVEVDGRMQDAFIATVETISGNEVDRDTGEIRSVTPGESRSYWLFATVVRNELKEAKPPVGERLVILDRGMKLKRAAVKAGKTLETADPKSDVYHDTHVAFPDRPVPVQEDITFDQL